MPGTQALGKSRLQLVRGIWPLAPTSEAVPYPPCPLPAQGAGCAQVWRLGLPAHQHPGPPAPPCCAGDCKPGDGAGEGGSRGLAGSVLLAQPEVSPTWHFPHLAQVSTRKGPSWLPFTLGLNPSSSLGLENSAYLPHVSCLHSELYSGLVLRSCSHTVLPCCLSPHFPTCGILPPKAPCPGAPALQHKTKPFGGLLR